jgi:hypothetical protein
MKFSIISFVLGAAAMAAFTTAAATNVAGVNSTVPTASEAKQAAPASSEPPVEPQFELMANDPDVVNRPER